MMSWQATVLCLLGFVGTAIAQPQVSYDFTPDAPAPSTTNINFTILISPNAATIATVEIVDATGSGSSPECTENFADLPGVLGGPTRGLLLSLSTSAAIAFSTAGKETCYVTGDVTTGMYTFTLRLREVQGSDSSQDRNYVLHTDLSGGGTVTVELVIDIVPLVDIQYTAELRVVDETNAVKTNFDLGDPAKLEFRMTVEPYIEGLTYAGATVHSCVMAEDATFSTNKIPLIDAISCSLQNGVFKKIPRTKGFTGVASESTTSGSTKTFVSRTPEFEVGGYSKEDPSGANEVYFLCLLRYCTNDSITTLGECGGNNCLFGSRRKKRESSPGDTVKTSIKINRPKQPGSKCTCPDPALLYGSMSGLSILAVTCFVVMIVTYIDLQRSTRKLSGRSAMKSQNTPQPTETPPSGKSVRSYRT